MWFFIIGGASLVGALAYGFAWMAEGNTFPDDYYPPEHYNRLK